MTRPSRFDAQELIALLGQPVTAPGIGRLFGADLEKMKRDEWWGSLAYGSEGVEITFDEAWYFFESDALADPHLLHFAAAHLYSDGYAGNCQFCGSIPGEIQFGDTAETVIQRLGEPDDRGGGARIPVLGIAPPWFRYNHVGHYIHFQFGRDRGVELVTLGCRQHRL